MKLPFHAVEVRGDILLAARGVSIHSFNLTDGSHIACSWKFPAAAEVNQNVALSKEEEEGDHPVTKQEDQGGPPAKRVKLDDGGEAPGEQPATTTTTGEGRQEAKADKTPSHRGGGSGDRVRGGGKKNKKQGGGPQPGPLSQPTERSMVILMTTTQDGQHVVAVTSDKSIWVLAHDGQGQLEQLSRRTMPKRPCSVIISPDNKNILSADKFGDVYSLPLIPSPDWKPSETSAAGASASTASPQPQPQPAAAAAEQHHQYKPQATELTVHTKRNLKALLDQQISAANPRAQQRGTPRRAESAPFERTLLLGHVSLLTAVAMGFDEDDEKKIKRPYVLTADRDEHIRVSRGTKAQAHVIEQFCLGHDQFVTRLCIPSSAGHLLVSAGGDPEVFVWRWKQGLLLGKAPLLDAVKSVVPGATKVAVTGLLEWSSPAAEEEQEGTTRIVVICERVPALFIYRLQASGALDFHSNIVLGGPPLDVAVVNSRELVVAVDLGLEEDSPNFVSSSLTRIQCAEGGVYSVGDQLIKEAMAVDLGDGEVDASGADIQKLLYNAETLRKMDSEDGGDAD